MARSPNLTKFQIARILAAIDGGSTPSAQARLHGYAPNTIAKLARRHGRRAREVNGLTHEQREAIRLRRDHTSIVAREYGVCGKTIARIRGGSWRRIDLTQTQLDDIRERAVRVKYLALAFDYGVSESTIKRIVGSVKRPARETQHAAPVS